MTTLSEMIDVKDADGVTPHAFDLRFKSQLVQNSSSFERVSPIHVHDLVYSDNGVPSKLIAATRCHQTLRRRKLIAVQ
jgi:hypothetical protein